MQKRHSFYRQTGRYLWLSTTVNILACTFMPLTHFSYAEFRFTLNPNRYKNPACIFVLYRAVLRHFFCRHFYNLQTHQIGSNRIKKLAALTFGSDTQFRQIANQPAQYQT